MDYLFSVWKLKSPQLIISVTGGATQLSLKQRLKETFAKSMVKAATTTSKYQTLDYSCVKKKQR